MYANNVYVGAGDMICVGEGAMRIRMKGEDEDFYEGKGDKDV